MRAAGARLAGQGVLLDERLCCDDLRERGVVAVEVRDDADGAFVSASSTCTNVDCHAGTTTPGWYVVGDAAAPVWTPKSGSAASNWRNAT